MKEYTIDTHEYKIDGNIIPRVTQLLPKQNFFCTPEQLEAARVEGVENHSMIKLYFDTNDTYDNQILIDLETTLKELNYLTGDIVRNENNLFSEKHRFAGTPDAVFEKAIVDFKRSAGNKKIAALQLAGYYILAKENKLLSKTKTWLILYYDNGKWKYYNVYNDKAENIFLSLVKKHNIEQNLKNYMEEV